MFSTSVGSVELVTPLLLASGYITETPEFYLRAQPEGCSGIVTRSLKKNVPPERERIPVPRYAMHGRDSMLNCEWGNEGRWTQWRDIGIPAVKKAGGPIILSLSGRDPVGCVELMHEFDAIGVDAYEVNVSCSHSGVLHGNLNVDIEHLESLMHVIRPATETPIWVKLSYSTQLVLMGMTAERLGANAIVCTNSIGPGMLIDTSTGRSKLGIMGGGGGLTGRAIFPIALWCVHQLAQNLAIPIVGCGGISTAEHAVQMMMAGASALQLYTAPALHGPRVFRRIMSGFERFLAQHPEYDSLRALKNVTAPHTVEHHFSSPPPVVIDERCTGCTLCVEACAFDALSLVMRENGKLLAVIEDNCVSCNACVGACPPKFDAIRASF